MCEAEEGPDEEWTLCDGLDRSGSKPEDTPTAKHEAEVEAQPTTSPKLSYAAALATGAPPPPAAPSAPLRTPVPCHEDRSRSAGGRRPTKADESANHGGKGKVDADSDSDGLPERPGRRTVQRRTRRSIASDS